ncbi:hypothetical protein B7494_g4524 [Chlorociboria aeruginascens]|nr:hypothetical protein B7494_g4524 [Chlorociboria aeruginascens]
MSLASCVANFFSGSPNSQQDRSTTGFVEDGGKSELADIRFGAAILGTKTMAQKTSKEETRPPYLHSMIAGAIGGTTGDLLMHSLDTVKTRQQGDPNIPPRYTTMSASYSTILRQEGIRRGLYGGWLPAMLGSFPGTIIFFGTYEYSKRHMIDFGVNPQFAYLTSGFLADFAASFIYVPSEVLKTRLQLQGRYNNPFFQSGYNYKSTGHAARTIVRQEGFSALFYGYKATIFRDLPFSALQFTFYEQGQIWARQWKQSRVIGLPLELLTGAAAGGLAGVITCPLDVVKTRIQTQVNPSSKTTMRSPSHSSPPAPCQGTVAHLSLLSNQKRSISTSSPSTHTPRPEQKDLEAGFAVWARDLCGPAFRVDGALRALRHLAWGTSWTIAFSTAVLTEDRRRRIRAAQEIRGNARKLKSSKQYHNSTTVALESFEQELGLRDDFTWDDKQVCSRGSPSVLSTSTADLNLPLSTLNPSPVSELPGRSSILKESPRQLLPILPSQCATTATITKISSVKRNADRFQRTFRANRLAYDIRTILQDGEDPEAVDAAASRFFEAFAEGIGFPLTQPLIEILVKLSNFCWYQSKQLVSEEILDVVLARGPIQEEDFYLLLPAKIIEKLLSTVDAPITDGVTDETKLKKAISLFLTKFKDKPKQGLMSKGMCSLGIKLCREAYRFEMYREVHAIYSRLKASSREASVICQTYLIRASHAQGHHMQTVQQFQKFYTLSVGEASSRTHQLMLYRVARIAIESALKIHQYDKAEGILHAAAKIVEHSKILLLTTLPMEVIGHVWRSTRDIARTQTLFNSCRYLINFTKHPQAVYTAMIQYCVEANDEDAAMSYYEELLKEYPRDIEYWRVYGHFALAQAQRKDWTRVEHWFSELSRLETNKTRYGRIFTPILKLYTQSHSIGEVEDFIRLYVGKYHVPLTSHTAGLVINTYGRAHEIDSLSRWLEYMIDTSVQLHPNFFNIILHKCYESWNFGFMDLHQLYEKVWELPSSAPFINDGTRSLLRSVAFAKAGKHVDIAWTQLGAVGLERLEGPFPLDSIGVQERMALEIAQGRPAKAIAIYWKASRRNIPLSSHVVVTAVKASLQQNESDFGATLDILENAEKLKQNTQNALSAILVHRIAELGADQSVGIGEIVAMARATILSLEERNVVVSGAAATQTANILVKHGRFRAAIDVWASMSRSRGFTSTSIDIPALEVLLRAYMFLKDCAGIQWVVKTISDNGLFPDSHFRRAIKEGRREAFNCIGSGLHAKRYYEVICAAYKQVVDIRVSAYVEKKDVTEKVLRIMKTACETQKNQVKQRDSQLDRIHLVPTLNQHDGVFTDQGQRVRLSPRITELQRIIKALSTTSSSRPLLSSWRILSLLDQAALSEVVANEEEEELTNAYGTELEWLLVSKATVQTYGLLLSTLLEQTIPLNEDIWYWDQVLGSYTYTGLYTIQTSPLRLWSWSKDIYNDTKARFSHSESPGTAISAEEIGMGLVDRWKQFYNLVRESIRDRSIADIQHGILSPIALCRADARRNQTRLRQLREMSASGLGVLMDEGLSFDIGDESTELVKTESNSRAWKEVVERSVALMDTVLCNVTALETGVSDFEDTVFASVAEDPEISSSEADVSQTTRPAKLSRRLQHILRVHVPNHVVATQNLTSQYGRPSKIIRYWLPASILLLSSTTILRILASRKAELLTWIQDFGATIRDFWMNWVVEPSKQVIGTIRHDGDSEVAIMSKESLKGDRDSLERMVVDFAIDNPAAADIGSGPLNETQISEIRSKVKEGDLTPVLRAYEKDLRQPFIGTVRGDLVRTLLIQIQKTKVDVEVALSGIDALLKSQELVFGFVSLTPGVLVCFGAFWYLGGVFGNRKGLKKGQKAGQTLRILRNIDRILTLATPTGNNILSYKDHGLLLCEVHVLRKHAQELFPGEIEREFLQDVGDLCNISSGIGTQLKVLERIRWSYSKWLK